ncbi:transporter substrate-binding domain-containing protein [Clostridium sp. SHJSY1]|uniref:substrate-binding periplasmic protein n=1 Tax=Clostridium sp. SHJSY1 TaxID=2942483 RepID=UPI002873F7B3|nr:transporter substrate-binding domain-containing protein [Clostridium sp. SHJSY1]MDS0525893.1 transporter substrate-binding domain-containing protein [Clostridium sp. SHJSY1]
MKTRFKFLVILVVILIFATNAQCTTIEPSSQNNISEREVDRLQKIKNKGVLTILSSNNEPYSYKNPRTGEFSGIDANIIKEVARRLGIKEVKAKYTYFGNLFEEFNKNPEIDLIIDGVFITDSRKQLVDFTIPIYRDWSSILTRKDSNINSKDDLKNVVAGAVQGEVYAPLVKEWKNEGKVKDYVTFFDRESSRIALNNKVIDAFLTDSIIGQNIVLKYPELKFKLLSANQYKPDLIYDVGYPLKKEDTILKDAINEKLQEMKNDGTLYDIMVKYGINEHYIK